MLTDGHLGVVVDPGAAERLGQLVCPWLRVPRRHVLGRRLRGVGGVEVIAAGAVEQP